MAKHALLTSSGSKRWLNCTPSARLEENFPNDSSVYAEEGTWAHELCEYKVKKYLHRRMKRPPSEFLTEEIDQITDVYAKFVIGIIEKLKETCKPVVLVKEQLDYSHIARRASEQATWSLSETEFSMSAILKQAPACLWRWSRTHI